MSQATQLISTNMGQVLMPQHLSGSQAAAWQSIASRTRSTRAPSPSVRELEASSQNQAGRQSCASKRLPAS